MALKLHMKPQESLGISMTDIVFSHTDKVRDSEVDMHRGVNNSIYLQYLQHARHEYLRAAGVDIDVYVPVVMEAHIKYQAFLTANDTYRVDIRVRRDKLTWHFLSDIANVATGKAAVSSDLHVVFFKDRRPSRDNILNH
jgi:acyl-CoA thioester hydrolase